jgi:transglutaminase-like putative cysteine protease
MNQSIENKQIKITKKILLPIEVPDNLKEYVKPSETIDSDNIEIFALANKLAEGENDLNKVVFNLAQWVNNNIEYNLSTSVL